MILILESLKQLRSKRNQNKKTTQVLKQVASKMQALEMAAPGMSPKQYQTELKRY